MNTTHRTGLDVKTLRLVVHYDSETGAFHYKERLGENLKPDGLGWVDSKGYRMLSIRGFKLPAHIAAYAYVHGFFPDKGQFIDHINHDRKDNRIENLRLVTNQQNQQNRKGIPNNTGISGIYYNRKTGKYQARIRIKGVTVYSKTWEHYELDKATQELAEVRNKLGFHKNHGN